MGKVFGVVAGLAWSCVALSAFAQAPDYQPPKLSWGVADISGSWTNTSITTLERPKGVEKLVLTPEEAQAIVNGNYHFQRDAKDRVQSDPNAPPPAKGAPLPSIGNYNTAYIEAGNQMGVVKGQIRSSWVVDPPDGHVPWKDKAAMAEALAYPYEDDIKGAASAYVGPESRGDTERCLRTNSPIMLNQIYNNNFRIVQTPGFVMINLEMVQPPRVIPIFKSAEEAQKHFGPLPKWLGDSVGWYEGDTLVIDTRNTHPVQTGHAMLGPNDSVIERLTRVGLDEIFYEFLVNNPKYYAKPWKGEMPLRRLVGEVYEYACHEGNYGLENILLGARVREAKGIKLTGAATTE